jgi:beta-lactam-binding protein with PASTA domain
MKKKLATALLCGLMLTGCGSTTQAAVVKTTPTASATKTVAPAVSITVPRVIDLTLDKATDQLKALGLKVESTDIENGKAVIVEENWMVVTQDPGAGKSVAKGSTVKLGVKRIVEPTPTPTPVPPAPAKFVAPVAPPAVAPKAPVVVPKAPAAAYYKNCTAARAAGAAPVYRGQAGYGSHLDRDGDGVGCE